MKRNFLKKTVLATLSAAMLLTTACNKEIKVDYGYNPLDYVELGDYKGIEVTIDRTSIENEQVMQKVEEDLEIYTTYDEVSRGAIDGDQVMFTYSGATEGIQKAGLSNTSGCTMILGKDELEIEVPELLEAVYGMKTDETKVLTVTLPEDYPDTLYASERVVFDIKMISVGQPNVPMLTDGYVKQHFSVNTIDEYLAHIKEEVKNDVDAVVSETTKTEVLKKLQSTSKVTGYPDKLMDELTELYEGSIGFYASYYEMSKEDYCQKTFGTSFDEYVKGAAAQTLILQAIVKQEKIKLWEYEYKGDLEEFALQNGFTNKDSFVEKFGKESIIEGMITQKAQDLVIDSAVVTYK